jgi:hypothetical protein
MGFSNGTGVHLDFKLSACQLVLHEHILETMGGYTLITIQKNIFYKMLIPSCLDEKYKCIRVSAYPGHIGGQDDCALLIKIR